MRLLKTMTNPSYEDILSLADATDIAILMHRDVHFGGQFDEMIDYYEKGGKGVNPDFEIARIRFLEDLEKKMKQNLAPLLLSGPDAEKVSAAKEAYKKLRTLYDQKPTKIKHPRLIADLILSENEDPEEEIAAIVNEKSAIVPALIQLLRSEEFHDSLFPGYGQAPLLAVKCLGKIGDKRAIIVLFESIGEEDVFDEEIALDALKAIGEPAKEFLLKVLHGRPLTFDNERAALALGRFKEDRQVIQQCFEMLKGLNFKKDILLAEYLVFACAGLQDPHQRQEFLRLADLPTTPVTMKHDIKTAAKEWE